MNYHEALAAAEVSVTFTATESRRLADLFNRLKSAGTPDDHLMGRMALRFARATERAEKKARAAVAP